MEVPSANDPPIRGKRTKRQRPADHSPTTSDVSTDEDEDLANCLILLAQGGGVNVNAHHHHQISASKAGFYVYECKTCNRTFQSFQALGGHRASHKRPKTAAPADVAAVEEKNPTVAVAIPITRNCNSPPLSLELTTNKIHECSICGSEFTSGQALGGHMRRHRAANTSTSEIKKGRNILQLDLNLPAPDDHDHDFQFTFTTPKLVNCHY